MLFLFSEVTKQEDTIYFQETNNKGGSCTRKADNAIGKCMPDYECANAEHIFKKFGIKPDICEFHHKTPIICCSDKNLYNQIDDRVLLEEIMDRVPNGISYHKCKEYSHTMDDHVNDRYNTHYAAIQQAPNIDLYGYQNKNPTNVQEQVEYPHIAAIGWKIHNDVAWNCGGSLISEEFVLTAGHCTDTNLGKPDIVRFTEQDLRQIIRGVLPEDYSIIEIIKHPAYKSASHYHDIALLRLDKHVIFTNILRPACLWQTFYLNNTFGRVLNWQHSEYDGRKSDILLKIDLDFYDNEQCEVYFPRAHKLENSIEISQICAGDSSQKHTPCPHHSTNYLDSGFGGPIQIKILSNNKYIHYIIGVTSFGKYCDAKTLEVYTRVSSFIDWIESVVWS